MNVCIVCNQPIDSDRLEFLLDFNKAITCIRHANETKKLALMDYAHKTGGTIVVLPDNKEIQRIAFRAYRRAR